MEVYWLEQTEADVPAAQDWLGASEAAVLAALRFPKRRADWRLGRWTAKRAAAAYLHRSIAEVEIRAAADGAPDVFVAGAPAAVALSLSHRAGVAVCAVAGAGAALGCDVERIEPRSAAFVSDYLTTAEQALVESAPADGRSAMLALLWSTKESVLKALRMGLRLDPRSTSVTLVDPPGAGPWRRLEARYEEQSFHGWWYRSGDLVRTVAAVPAPDVPRRLDPV